MPGSQHSAVEEVCRSQLKPLDFVALIPLSLSTCFYQDCHLPGPSQHHFLLGYGNTIS